MRPIVTFTLLAVLIFGGLSALGFYFLGTDPVLFVVTEILTLLTVVFFILLYRRLVKPYRVIASGLELLSEQDFSTRLRPVSDSQANRLIAIFNRMMDQLKNERLLVREKNRFLDLLIEASPQGVMILDFDDRITSVNSAAVKLLHIKDVEAVIGKLPQQAPIAIGTTLSQLKEGEDLVVRTSGTNILKCSRSYFIDRGFHHPFILIEELTRELFQMEKESYERVIRMMAHEVNNSVGAVCSTLNVISDSLNAHPENELSDVLPAVEASFERCRNLGKFTANFAEVVKIPDPVLTRTDLCELARLVEALTHADCARRQIRLQLDITEEPCRVLLDSILMEQVLVNIVKNACEAIGTNGFIRMVVDPVPATITIIDNGCGIDPSTREKIFSPFFTTKTNGQGVGLTFVREVLLKHDCTFDLTSARGLTRFVISFGDSSH